MDLYVHWPFPIDFILMFLEWLKRFIENFFLHKMNNSFKIANNSVCSSFFVAVFNSQYDLISETLTSKTLSHYKSLKKWTMSAVAHFIYWNQKKKKKKNITNLFCFKFAFSFSWFFFLVDFYVSQRDICHVIIIFHVII